MSIIGIDLGTTKSACAVWQDEAPVIIAGADGDPILPSVLALDPAGAGWVVGKQAKAVAVEHPSLAAYSVKRFMGRRFSDESVADSIEKLRVLYQVEQSRTRRDRIEVVVGGRRLTPQEVSAKILQHLKERAEEHLNRKITEAVVTVPAYFHDSQRQATRDAGALAGLNVRRVLSEPTAACLAFGYKKLNEERKTVAVYDLGGGTFDVSILVVGRGPFRVKATNGDPYLGGDDVDWAIVDWVLEQVGGVEAQRLRGDTCALARLRAAAELTKRELSEADQARLMSQSPGSQTPEVDLTLTRADLKRLATPIIDRTLVACARALDDAHLSPSEIGEVLLVGGQTQMQAVREAVREFFGTEPNTSVKPEEVVALGAAVQAAIITGELKGLKLADVLPLTLGVSTEGRMDAIIPRNTPIPVEKSKLYSTARDNQESVEVKIYQGEEAEARKNISLASFILKGIAPAPAGQPEIDVIFKVDQDGILHVTGKDLRTGNVKEVTVTGSMRLSEEEIRERVNVEQGVVLEE
jgi:molecular chaperone DnaK